LHSKPAEINVSYLPNFHQTLPNSTHIKPLVRVQMRV